MRGAASIDASGPSAIDGERLRQPFRHLARFFFAPRCISYPPLRAATPCPPHIAMKKTPIATAELRTSLSKATKKLPDPKVSRNWRRTKSSKIPPTIPPTHVPFKAGSSLPMRPAIYPPKSAKPDHTPQNTPRSGSLTSNMTAIVTILRGSGGSISSNTGSTYSG